MIFSFVIVYFSALTKGTKYEILTLTPKVRLTYYVRVESRWFLIINFVQGFTTKSLKQIKRLSVDSQFNVHHFRTEHCFPSTNLPKPAEVNQQCNPGLHYILKIQFVKMFVIPIDRKPSDHRRKANRPNANKL